MSLTEYRHKRHFNTTAEPRGKEARSNQSGQGIFVIQKHAATRLHYDFRLEHEGVLKSWAVPNGPSLDPNVKALAVQVEDHPLEYATFEGTIPKGEYGGGTVLVWDRGTWATDEDVSKALKRGKLSFQLDGEKLHGSWTLVRMHGRESENWLLIKKQDEHALPGTEHALLEEQSRSVATGRTLSEIADNQSPAKKHGAKKQRASSKRSIAKKSITKSTPKAAQRRANDIGLLDEASAVHVPELLQPQLAQLVKETPTGSNWLHEIKLDGYRILARFDHQQVTLWTRGGQDWTHRFPHVAQALNRMNLNGTWLDGEIVVQDAQGFSNFQLLQNALSRQDDRAVIYYIFDLPYLNGRDLTSRKLIERKQLLQSALRPFSSKAFQRYVQFHEHIEGSGRQVLDSACQLQLEGIVSKRIDSPYEFKRTSTWLKTKCAQIEEFIIAGYTKPQGQRKAFGALLLGIFDDDELVYCGRVGTGFTEESLAELKRRFLPLASDECPFKKRPTTAQLRGVHWLRPELIAQINFANRTTEGLLRHAVFHGLREDMQPEDVTMKKKSASRTAAKPKVSRSGRTKRTDKEPTDEQKISHPDRIVYPDLNLTKADVVAYFEQISPWLLPGVVGRPLTILRCPQGIGHTSFYQKHFEEHLPPGVYGAPIQEEKDVTTYAMIKDVKGLVSLAQWNAIELHPWPALAKRIEKPDRLIFDLDPGEGAAWSSVIQAAKDIRQMLEDVELQSFLRTSGGKGLHVVVPLRAGSTTWDELKAFAKVLAQTLAKQHPDRITATLSKASRRGKVFVDYLRNGRGATAIASFCPRARPGAHVAMPLRWSELSEKTTNDAYSITNVVKLMKRRRSEIWEGFDQLKQSLPTF